MIPQQLMPLTVLLLIAVTVPLSESNGGHGVKNDYYEAYDVYDYSDTQTKKPVDTRIPCYSCTYLPGPGVTLGSEDCDEPFDERHDFPEIMCNGSCMLTQIFKIDAIYGNRTEKILVNRGCLDPCQELNTLDKVVRCCNRRLCNSFNSASLQFYVGVYIITLTLLCISLLQNLLP